MSGKRQYGRARIQAKGKFRSTASAVASEVKKELARTLEKKHLDYYLDTGGTMPVAGALYEINQISQGTTVSTRVGNKINYHSLIVRPMVFNQSVTMTTRPSHLTRLILFLWKPNSAPSVANILHDVSSGRKIMFSPFNMEYKKSFNVLYDSGPIMTTNLYGDSGATHQNAGTFLEAPLPLIVKPLTSVVATYDGTSSTNSDNRLYVLYAGDEADKTDIEGWITLKWTDA